MKHLKRIAAGLALWTGVTLLIIGYSTWELGRMFAPKLPPPIVPPRRRECDDADADLDMQGFPRGQRP